MAHLLRLLSALAMLSIVAAVMAQPVRAPATPASALPQRADDMPMADYLGLLAQIAPAARNGAEAYAQAYRHRCGRALKTAELRRAMSDGNGDPALMAMIRASQLRDAKALADLAQGLRCGSQR